MQSNSTLTTHIYTHEHTHTQVSHFFFPLCACLLQQGDELCLKKGHRQEDWRMDRRDGKSHIRAQTPQSSTLNSTFLVSSQHATTKGGWKTGQERMVLFWQYLIGQWKCKNKPLKSVMNWTAPGCLAETRHLLLSILCQTKQDEC